MSNGYDIEFDFSGVSSELTSRLRNFDITVPANNDAGVPGSLINMFCDEAQLPNSQAATGQMNGRYLGEGVINYPHTKLVSDFSLSWICDANMAPYKFLMLWHNYIFDAAASGDNKTNSNTIQKATPNSLKDFKSTATAKPPNRPTRLKYPNQYQATLRIAKTEKGKNAPNSRVPLVYVMEQCYPYSVDAVPLSYGTSQIVKVTANFYYSKHTLWFADIRTFQG